MPAALLFPTPSRMFTCIRTSKEPLAWLLMISTVLVSILAIRLLLDGADEDWKR